MPTQITINSISGVSPYDVYLCDNPITTCIWIDTIISSQLPYIFDVPSILESQTIFNLKVIDNNNCQVISYLDTTSTTTTTVAPTTTTTTVPIVPCLNYSFSAYSDGVLYSIEGCCSNSCSTQFSAPPYGVDSFCSSSPPILISGYADLSSPVQCSPCPPVSCAEYLGHDLVFEIDTISVNFLLKLPTVLVGLPLIPCTAGFGTDCPQGIITYTINGLSATTTTITSDIWGKIGGGTNPYILGCEIQPFALNSFVSLAGYEGTTVTIVYNVTYPSTPPFCFTETIIYSVP